MIKSKYILGMFLSAGSLLTACQSEPEVGSTLYPTEPEDYSVKAYALNMNNNLKSVVEQGYGQNSIVVPNDTLRFKVKLTEPATKNLTFKAIPENLSGLNKDAFTFSTEQITVEKGADESKEEFKVALNPEAQSLINLTGKDKITVSFKSLDDIKLAKQNISCSWEIEKIMTYVNPNGTIEGLSKLAPTTYKVDAYSYYGTYPMDENGFFLNNKKVYAYFMSNVKYRTIHITLNEAGPISGIGILCPANNGALSSVQIYAGMDSNDLKKVGDATRLTAPTQQDDPFNVIFYEPLTVKYIDIIINNTFGGTETNPYITGMKIYKK